MNSINNYISIVHINISTTLTHHSSSLAVLIEIIFYLYSYYMFYSISGEAKTGIQTVYNVGIMRNLNQRVTNNNY